jgi:hypothetical protein
MNEQTKQIVIKDFLNSLSQSNHLTTNRVSIIIEKPGEEFMRLIPDELQSKSIILKINNKTTVAIFEHLKKDLETKDYIFLFLSSEVSESIYNQLFLLSKNGFIDITMPGRTDRVVVHLNEKNNIILVGERQMLENQHDNLINLGNQFLDINAYV